MPLLGLLHQFGAERISLDVADDLQQVLIRLHLKRFKTALIQMAGSSGVIMGVPTHGVGHRQLPKKLTDLIVSRRTHDKMPMIGH